MTTIMAAARIAHAVAHITFTAATGSAPPDLIDPTGGAESF
ncbi:hypothetical protein [Streptomyces sp. NPDC093109]